MGKKDKKFITLSEVDHKLQFISVVAVIGDITPIIFRSKLTKVELCILDETVEKTGFNVKLNIESKMLNQFLDVAKRGFIIQLSDIKVVKNEGEVYGMVRDEEEITLYNDSVHVQKWYPGEKPTAVTDTIKYKIQSLLKWKKANSKNIEILPVSDEEKTKTGRRGPSCENKLTNSPLRKSRLEISGQKNYPTDSFKANKLLTSSEETGSPNSSSSRVSVSSSPTRITRAVSASSPNEVKNKVQSLLKRKNKLSKDVEMLPGSDEEKTKTGRSGPSFQNKLTNTPSRRSKLGISGHKKYHSDHLKVNTKLSSSEETGSPNSSSSKASVSSSTTRITRAVSASSLSKSSSLNSLNKTLSSKFFKKSSSLSRLNKSDIHFKSNSDTSSRLNRSESQISLGGSRRKKFTKSMEAKGGNSESDSSNSRKFNRSRNASKIKIIALSSDSDTEKTNSKQNPSEKYSCNFSSVNFRPDEENNESNGKNKVSQTRSSLVNRNNDVSFINTSSVSLRNKSKDNLEVKSNFENKDRSKCLHSKNEDVLPNSRYLKENQRNPVIRDTDKHIESVETKSSRNKKLDCTGAKKVVLNSSVSAEADSKVARKQSAAREKSSSPETLKITRQTIKSKTEGLLSFDNTSSPICKDSTSSPTTKTNRTSRLENNTNNEIILTKTKANEVETVTLVEKNLGTNSPLRKMLIRSQSNIHASDMSIEVSPKLKPGHFKRNPTLNSSDSSLSDCLNSSVKHICNSKAVHMRKRECREVENSSQSLSKKKSKLDQETIANENKCFEADLTDDSCHPVNEREIQKTTKENETNSKEESDMQNKEIANSKIDKSGLDLKTVGKKQRKFESNNTAGKTVLRDKEDLSSEIMVTPKTRDRALQKSEQKETCKGGIFANYLRPLTKKLNFISVESIADISLYDLDEVDFPDKFDLQCKVVSAFVFIEEGIQVVRVQDGTTCKRGTLRIPEVQSWDIVLKDILENPIVEVKSPYIDIIIFNYFRLDFPLILNKFFQINNIMAVKFQLKRDPRPKRMTNTELFFCVEGQNANVKKLSTQQIKKLSERFSADSFKNSLPPTSNAVIDKPASDSGHFKLPNSPKTNSKSNLSLESKSPLKIKPNESSCVSRKRMLNDSDSDVEPEAKSQRKEPPVENTTNVKNLTKDLENGKSIETASDNLQAKLNATISSDETLMGETPPLMKEISEIMHEEPALGLPLTISEDIHLKNSGSEVTFSQFCEGAKLKGDNFRTSTQDDEVRIGTTSIRLSNLPKGVSLTKKEGFIILEDSSKMEPLVYCPSGSSASSAICGTPDKGKSHEIQQDIPQCSGTVLQIAQLRTISNLNSSEFESVKGNNDNTSDTSNSASVKVISSNNSEEVDVDILTGKRLSKIKSLSQVTEDELSKSPEVEVLLNDVQKKSPIKLKSKESESELGISKEIVVGSDDSSNVSLLATVDNKATKSASSFNNINDNGTAPTSENINLKMIPDRCFYKSPIIAPTLTEIQIDEIYDDEICCIKYFSYFHNRDLPMLTIDIVKKIKNTNSLTMTVTFTDISPAFTDSWRGSCIKARCPTCDKLYNVYNASNNQIDENASSTAAISVGSHVVCPDSQCCNQILENPAFLFTVEFNFKDGTPLSALLAGNHAEGIFGCSAQEAVRNETALDRVAETLEKITKVISDKLPTKVVVTREDICDPKSGPLYISRIDV